MEKAIKVGFEHVSRYRKLKSSWEHCTRCKLSKYRKNVVFGRGTLPCEVLFVGEAPGKDEDRHGYAFVGRAGQLLDKAMHDSGLISRRWFITNMVGCRPCDGVGMPNRQPEPDEIAPCQDRLVSTVYLASPTDVVLMGRTAQLWYPIEPAWTHGVHRLPHPAYILRSGGEKSPLYSTFVRSLEEVKKWLEKR